MWKCCAMNEHFKRKRVTLNSNDERSQVMLFFVLKALSPCTQSRKTQT